MKHLAIPLAFLACLPTGHVQAQGIKRFPGDIYAKPGVAAAKAQKDEADCKDLSVRVFGGDVPLPPVSTQSGSGPIIVSYYPSPASAAGSIQPGAAIAAVGIGMAGIALYQGYQYSKIQSAAFETCMRNRGYGLVKLTQAERLSRNRAATSAAQAQWVTDFMNGDIAQRVSPDLTPKTPPLQRARNEPFAVGGVVLDPASLALTAEPVEVKGVLLKGTARTRAVAKVKSTVAVSRNQNLMEGEVLRLVYPGRYPIRDTATDSSAWCGMITQGARKLPACFGSDHEGHPVYQAVGQPWYYNVVHSLTPDRRVTSPIELTPMEPDPAETFDFSLRVFDISKSAVSLIATLSHDGKQVDIWAGSVELDLDGRAIGAFWNRSLVMTVKDEKVNAIWGEGDGLTGLLTAK